MSSDAPYEEDDLETVILCGGLGTRLSEETQIKPKPMVEIGGRPILWHIMKIYERYGLTDFTLALGYKGEVIKDYFLNYHARQSDLVVHLKKGQADYSNPTAEDWRVSLIDTGVNTLTGGRLLRLKPHLQSLGTFMLTYGDGVSDVDITALLALHRAHGRVATVTAVRRRRDLGDAYQRRPGARLQGKAAIGRGLDQRWIFCLRTCGLRLPGR
jgi:glucose-1-phosphate cytidylyltransferase